MQLHRPLVDLLTYIWQSVFPCGNVLYTLITITHSLFWRRYDFIIFKKNGWLLLLKNYSVDRINPSHTKITRYSDAFHLTMKRTRVCHRFTPMARPWVQSSNTSQVLPMWNIVFCIFTKLRLFYLDNKSRFMANRRSIFVNNFDPHNVSPML